MHECALGYSGWFGVAGSSGVQAGSPTVASLPSVSAGPDGGDRPPERVVVLGVEAGDERVGVGHGHHRHEPRRVHDVQAVVEHELAERAVCLLDRGSAQKRAASVCSAVRVVLVLEPISLTSL